MKHDPRDTDQIAAMRRALRGDSITAMAALPCVIHPEGTCGEDAALRCLPCKAREDVAALTELIEEAQP